MKNLFKNLMLVAVAAMAFTACEEASEPVVKNEKHTITFIADFESETRSAFGELNGTSYPSYWEGTEKAKFNHWTEYSGNKEEKVVTISNDNRFSVAFDIEVGYGTNIDAYVPAESWGDVQMKWEIDDDTYACKAAYREYTIPAEQNPTATSVDPKAHILKAEFVYLDEDNVQITFKHQVAYGKFSIKNLALESGDAVKNVVLNINDEIYVINTVATADDIWFACEPATVENMKVTFNTTNGKGYEKVLVENYNKPLEFVKGQVAEFGVDMDGVTPKTNEVIAFDGTIKSWTHTGDYGIYLVEGDNFSFNVGQYNNYLDRLFKRSDKTCTLSSYASSSKYFTVSNFKDASIGVGILQPTAGTLVVNEGGKSAEIHDVTITLTINDKEYVYTYYGYIGGEAVEK